jgi:hypothetical protein
LEANLPLRLYQCRASFRAGSDRKTLKNYHTFNPQKKDELALELSLSLQRRWQLRFLKSLNNINTSSNCYLCLPDLPKLSCTYNSMELKCPDSYLKWIPHTEDDSDAILRS